MIFILLAGVFGALATFYLNNTLQLGGIMASAGISVMAGGFFYLFPELLNPFLSVNVPLVIMGSSFIGMATSRVIKQYWIIALSGVFFSGIFLPSSLFFEGYGGSLGTIAAISLGAAYAMRPFKKNSSFLKQIR